MYIIDTEKDKPDIEYLRERARNMMKRGVKIGVIDHMLDSFKGLLEEIKGDIDKEYGIMNPNSTQQIVNYMKTLANMATSQSPDAKNDIIEACLTRSGKWTTDATALKKLEDLGYEFASDIMSYRETKKYVDTLEGLKEAMDDNKLIHPTVSLAVTNRINYSEPPLMQIPKELLWSVITPFYEGDSLFSVDIKNQEPSILINFLNDPGLKSVLTSGEDLYEGIFKKVFIPEAEMNMINETLPESRLYLRSELRNIPVISPALYQNKKPPCDSYYYNGERIILIETLCYGYNKDKEIQYPEKVRVETEEENIYEVPVVWDKNFKAKKTGDFKITGVLQGVEIRISKTNRSEFKTAWNALTYGASYMGVKDKCNSIDGGMIYKYFGKIKAFKEYKTNIKDIIESGSTSVRTLFGTPVGSNADKDNYAALKRSMLNIPIQGTGADILSCLIKHFDMEIRKLGLNESFFIYYTRHDELIIEVSKYWLKDNRDKVEDVLRNLLEHRMIYKGTEWVPFKVEVKEVVAG